MKFLLLFGLIFQVIPVFACPVFNSAYRYQSPSNPQYLEYLQIETNISPDGISSYEIGTVIGGAKEVYVADGLPQVRSSDGETYTVTCAYETLYIKAEFLDSYPNPHCNYATGSKYLAYTNFIKEGLSLRRTVSEFRFCSNGYQYDHHSSDNIFDKY